MHDACIQQHLASLQRGCGFVGMCVRVLLMQVCVSIYTEDWLQAVAASFAAS